MTEKEILRKIEDYMVKHNLRQWEFAKQIGIPDGTLNRWLRGRSNISRAYLNILKKEGVI
ncbi:helix-turn-helix domain-containing protein [Candidatus Omnitrophota bacterium]